jgi:superfamily I DNA/RNA helicase
VAIPPWLAGIEGEHVTQLIESDVHVIAVVAGPGSGKTTGIKRRVQRLIEGDEVPPERIFVGTFTRAIAGELRASLGEELRVSTLHSLALRLLRENPAALGGRNPRFLLQFEENAMLYDVGREMPEAGDHRSRRRLLDRTQSSRSERTALPDAQFAGRVDNWL